MLLTLLLGGGPVLVVARPPADPVVVIVNTGSGGLAVLTDTAGRRIALGGSAGRTDAAAALDRHLPPWERRLDLLLAPPRADHLPGALEVLDRRPVGQARLLGLATQPHPALDAWQRRHPPPPVAGRAIVALAGAARVQLDTGAEAGGEGSLALIERGSVRLLLLVGDAAPLVAARLTRGDLSPAAVVARLSPGVSALPPSLVPAVLIALDDGSGMASSRERQIMLAPGAAVRITLRSDRLLIHGADPIMENTVSRVVPNH